MTTIVKVFGAAAVLLIAVAITGWLPVYADSEPTAADSTAKYLVPQRDAADVPATVQRPAIPTADKATRAATNVKGRSVRADSTRQAAASGTLWIVLGIGAVVGVILIGLIAVVVMMSLRRRAKTLAPGGAIFALAAYAMQEDDGSEQAPSYQTRCAA